MTSVNQAMTVRWRRLGRVEFNALVNWAAAVLLAVPLSLLWAEGFWGALGVGYLVGYFGLMVVPTAVNILSLYDALRVALRRPAVIAPWMVGFALLAKWRGDLGRVSPLIRLVIRGNPLVGLAREAWIVALRWNPAAGREIWRAGRLIAEQTQRDRLRPSTMVAYDVENAFGEAAELGLVPC